LAATKPCPFKPQAQCKQWSALLGLAVVCAALAHMRSLLVRPKAPCSNCLQTVKQQQGPGDLPLIRACKMSCFWTRCSCSSICACLVFLECATAHLYTPQVCASVLQLCCCQAPILCLQRVLCVHGKRQQRQRVPYTSATHQTLAGVSHCCRALVVTPLGRLLLDAYVPACTAPAEGGWSDAAGAVPCVCTCTRAVGWLSSHYSRLQECLCTCRFKLPTPRSGGPHMLCGSR
jgi:hypothetical protein